jgi:Yip1 domain
MSEQESAPALSQLQRITNTFIAPGKTFADINRSASWWLPWLLSAVVSLLYSAIVITRVGMETIIDGIIAHSPRLATQLAQNPLLEPKVRDSIAASMKLMWVSPILSIIVALAIASLFLGSANFIFGGRATYTRLLAVWYYASLPLLIYFLIIILMAAFGLTGENFYIKNPIGTNIGFYLDGTSVPAPIIALLTALDVFSIWTAVLLTLGISTVAGIRRSSAAIVVFGWWLGYIGLQMLGALFS